MMRYGDETCPCYNGGKGCDKRQATAEYNCHSHCPEFKKWLDRIEAEGELVKSKKAEESDYNCVRISSIKKTQRVKEQQKCKWGG